MFYWIEIGTATQQYHLPGVLPTTTLGKKRISYDIMLTKGLEWNSLETTAAQLASMSNVNKE